MLHFLNFFIWMSGLTANHAFLWRISLRCAGSSSAEANYEDRYTEVDRKNRRFKLLYLKMHSQQIQVQSIRPSPKVGTLGYFFEENEGKFAVDHGRFSSQVECNLLHCVKIDGIEYGVGVPVDIPVSLTYFEGNDLKELNKGHPEYAEIFQMIASQMDENDLLLFDTPAVLTLQGEFEDENLSSDSLSAHTVLGNNSFILDNDDNELSVDEVVSKEGIDEGLDEIDDAYANEEEYNQEEHDYEDEDEDSDMKENGVEREFSKQVQINAATVMGKSILRLHFNSEFEYVILFFTFKIN